MNPVIVLPYFSQEEISRYLKIVRHIGQYPRPQCSFRFLLAASPRTELDALLHSRCEEIAPTYSMQCSTQVFGYPHGATAMFWDVMDYVDQKWGAEAGFSLWLESDMVPVHETWLDQLTDEWSSANDPLLMGCYVPPIYKRRFMRSAKFMLDEHVNGGACYAKNLASSMPRSVRTGVFDMVVYPIAKSLGTVVETQKIGFSTIESARRDLLNPSKVLVHGYMQDKQQFVDRCVAPVLKHERLTIPLIPALNRIDMMKRHFRVWFFRFGRQAMFENMMLTKNQSDSKKRAA